MIKVIQIGLGPLGRQTAKYIFDKSEINTVAAVDILPELKDQDLGALVINKPSGTLIKNSLKDALKDLDYKPDAAIITTLSSIQKLASQIEEVASYGIPIVSTCEELFHPWEENPESAKEIDEICKKYGVACLGVGINPGFLMDYLPAVLSSVCKEIESVKVERIQDASPRRLPFQKKIGAGLTLEEFKSRELTGTLRHVGLKESVYFLAKNLGFKLDKVTEDLNPVVAEESITKGSISIDKGNALGVEQISRGYVNGVCKIEMHFRAAIGEPHAYDRVTIKGVPSFTSEIDHGINGDIATCAIAINSVKSILKASPGLQTMASIGVPGYLN